MNALVVLDLDLLPEAVLLLVAHLDVPVADLALDQPALALVRLLALPLDPLDVVPPDLPDVVPPDLLDEALLDLLDVLLLVKDLLVVACLLTVKVSILPNLPLMKGRKHLEDSCIHLIDTNSIYSVPPCFCAIGIEKPEETSVIAIVISTSDTLYDQVTFPFLHSYEIKSHFPFQEVVSDGVLLL